MDWVIIVTVLALLQFTWFGLQVAATRSKHGIRAPAMSGAPEFDRAYRVHGNTLEQLVTMLPLMWIFAHVVSPYWAAGFGAVFIAGRFVYRAAYLRDPASRSPGFTISILPSMVMAVWLLIAAVRNLL